MLVDLTYYSFITALRILCLSEAYSDLKWCSENYISHETLGSINVNDVLRIMLFDMSQVIYLPTFLTLHLVSKPHKCLVNHDGFEINIQDSSSHSKKKIMISNFPWKLKKINKIKISFSSPSISQYHSCVSSSFEFISEVIFVCFLILSWVLLSHFLSSLSYLCYFIFSIIFLIYFSLFWKIRL